MIYVIYLLFQLKSHAYMYQSIPKDRIDEESRPGVLANFMGSSSSSDSSSSSSSTDSDSSSGSDTTVKRIRRVMRKGRRRRKSSVSSKDPVATSTPRRRDSEGSSTANFETSRFRLPTSPSEGSLGRDPELAIIASGDEADIDKETKVSEKTKEKTVNFRHTARANVRPGSRAPERQRKKHRRKVQIIEGQDRDDHEHQAVAEKASDLQLSQSQPPLRPSRIRNIYFRPRMPRTFATGDALEVRHVSLMEPGLSTTAFAAAAPRGMRRTASLPERLNQQQGYTTIFPARPPPFVGVNVSRISLDSKSSVNDKKNVSKMTAIILLLVVTGLVALCAEFLVGSINELVRETGVSEVFVGLIILPIVGNAAEHVTAVTVAAKNKMDLAIGVALGSSIQIGKQGFVIIVAFALIVASLSTKCRGEKDSFCLVSLTGGISIVRDSRRRPPRLDFTQGHVFIFHPLRNRLSLRLGLYRQLSRPRWSKQLP